MVLEETESRLIEKSSRDQGQGPDSFRELFDRYKDRVYSIALRYSGDHGIAQDIVQETFLKLFAGIGSFRGDSSFDSWLYRLVVNACFDQRRKTYRLVPLIESFLDFMPTPGGSALDEVLRAEVSEHIRGVVDDLPPDQRMIIVLRYTEGLSYDEIAAILGCPAGTIASRLNRVHKILERRLLRLAAVGGKKRG